MKWHWIREHVTDCNLELEHEQSALKMKTILRSVHCTVLHCIALHCIYARLFISAYHPHKILVKQVFRSISRSLLIVRENV